MKPGSPLELLQSNARFRRLWLAQLTSMAGDFISQVALSALLFRLSGQAAVVGLLTVASNLPIFIASPVAGAVADRFNRLHVMLICDLLRAALILGLLAVKDPNQVWLALLLVALVETASAFFEPASSAVLPQVVEERHLAAAITLGSISWSSTLAIGAAVGGVIVTKWGAPAAFWVNSASFLISALLILSVGLSSQSRERPPKPFHPLRDVREGLGYVATEPRLQAVLLIKFTFGLGLGVISLLTVLPMQVFASKEAGVSLLYSARGLGAVGGPFLSGALSARTNLDLAKIAGLGVVTSGIFYGVVSASPHLYWAAVFVCLAHIGSGLQWVLSTLLLQRYAAEEFRGRVMALDFAGITLALSLSSWLFGVACDHFGPREAGGGTSALLVLLGLAWLLYFPIYRRQLFVDKALSD